MMQILLIDDDQRLTRMLADYLQLQGLQVQTAATGQAGLQLLQQQRFDALVLDLMLPDADGLDLCRTIRQQFPLPILMLSARGDVADRIVGLELGADDYLGKPFDARELLARLRAITRRQQDEPRAQLLQLGSIELDPDSRTLSVAGERRALTGHQFDLLWCLARNAGRVMSRDQIMQSMRGEHLEAFDRSIDVHISKLRQALGDDPKQPERILTIRGIGYMLARPATD
ncbi:MULTISPECIES: response regulator [Leeia]|nr:response regulator transcription factor [Leeia aquatica]